MAGTKEGGRKAAATNKANDPNFYAKIGAKGGTNGHTGGFASTEVGPDGLTGPQRASKVGVAGGRKSKPYSKINKVQTVNLAPVKKSIFTRIFGRTV